MSALIYGAGAIGRGVLGPMARMAGIDVVFSEIKPELIERINEDARYTITMCQPKGEKSYLIDGVRAVHSSGSAKEVARADFIMTAVGAGALGSVADCLAPALEKRFSGGGAPINVFLCENMPDAAAAMREALCARLRGNAGILSNVGLVKCCVGSTVPEQLPAVLKAEPLRLYMEAHKPLYLNADALVLPAPKMDLFLPHSPFQFIIERKLFIHNMAHALLAYAALYRGNAFIHEVISAPSIRVLCVSAMEEAAAALSRAWGEDIGPLRAYIDDLIERFAYPGLPVDAHRTGADIPRKLSKNDRLVGAANLCLAQGVAPRAISFGIAAALNQYLKESGEAQTAHNARAALIKLAGDDQLWGHVAPHFEALNVFTKEERERP